MGRQPNICQISLTEVVLASLKVGTPTLLRDIKGRWPRSELDMTYNLRTTGKVVAVRLQTTFMPESNLQGDWVDALMVLAVQSFLHRDGTWKDYPRHRQSGGDPFPCAIIYSTAQRQENVPALLAFGEREDGSTFLKDVINALELKET